ncbi:ABC transporter transmembrane region [Ceratobasidium sp. AG-Ba]|nr:ABC transporter transmembrane region [Ceratobasidium sp. AG-Ba]
MAKCVSGPVCDHDRYDHPRSLSRRPRCSRQQHRQFWQLPPTNSPPDNKDKPPNDMRRSGGYAKMEEAAPAPSLKLLFAHCTRQDVVSLIIPAVFVSLLSGGVAPFMTRVIGQAFDAFASFPSPAAQTPLSPSELEAAKSKLLNDVGITAIQLLALAGGSLLLSSVLSFLWIWVAERNVMRLRRGIYEAVTTRQMEWFDAQMAQQQEGDGVNVTGAGGMMAKFSRDTEDIRSATSLAMGQLIQHLTTVLAALILALVTSWSLTLLVLASIPLLVILQGVSQSLAMPRYDTEQNLLAQAGDVTATSMTAIATVKAFNAQSTTASRVNVLLDRARKAAHASAAVWGFTAGGTQFILFAMFVQGFWFGSALVRKGHVSPGQVMGVFWACLIAASNLQMCVPLFVTISKGKSAAVAVAVILDPLPAVVVRDGGEGGEGGGVRIPLMPRGPTHRIPMRRITPEKCQGELGLHNIVLRDVSMFIPANEMTFVVGGSGSGKSTVAQVMCGMYKIRSERARPGSNAFGYTHDLIDVGDSKSPRPSDAKSPRPSGLSRGELDDPEYREQTPGGMVVLDDQQLDVLDERWARKHVALVSQQCILFDMSVHDNVAIGLAGREDEIPDEEDPLAPPSAPYVPRVSRSRVMDACRVALLHEFIRELPDGYDTILNGGGGGRDEEAEEGKGRISLSGGQRQRLAIARAWMRNPTVLILDEATSALDATSRILVFEAIKAWRRNKTTVVITHDLSQIEPSDFVYVMKDGRVVQEGYRHNLEVDRVGTFAGMAGPAAIQEQPREDEGEIHMERRKSQKSTVSRRSTYVIDSDEEFEYAMVTRAEARHVTSILEQEEGDITTAPFHRKSLSGPSMWMLDAIADISGASKAPVQSYNHRHPSNPPLPSLILKEKDAFRRRRSSVDMSNTPQLAYSTGVGRRSSLQWEPQSPTSPTFAKAVKTPISTATATVVTPKTTKRKSNGTILRRWTRRHEDSEPESETDSEAEENEAFERQKAIAQASGMAASRQRKDGLHRERKEPIIDLVIPEEGEEKEKLDEQPPTLTSVIKRFYPTVPNKLLVVFGLIASLASGAMTPIFSFLLATLMSEVAAGGRNVPLITRYALLVLLAAFGDGLTGGLKFFLMEVAAMNWVTSLRERCLDRILAQDKKWFDDPAHSAATIAQVHQGR